MSSSCFLFHVDSQLRVRIKAADPAGEFRFELSSTQLVVVRDLVDDADGLPLQRGLEVQVTVTADSLDDTAFAEALGAAETTLILLSGAARAPAGDAQFQLAYELPIEPGDRAFLQHLPVDDIPVPRVPASVDWLDHVWVAIHRAAQDDPSLTSASFCR